jgi:hypothetical protein
MYSEIIVVTKQLQKATRGPDKSPGFCSRFYWAAFQKPKIVGLRAALEAYKSRLTLVLGTINVVEKAARPRFVNHTAYYCDLLGLSRRAPLVYKNPVEDDQDRAILEV